MSFLRKPVLREPDWEDERSDEELGETFEEEEADRDVNAERESNSEGDWDTEEEEDKQHMPPPAGPLLHQLPQELKNNVWEELMPGPRYVLLSICTDSETVEERDFGPRQYRSRFWDEVSARAHLPPILGSISSEAREYAQKTHELSFSRTLEDRPIYINFDTDTIVLRFEVAERGFLDDMSTADRKIFGDKVTSVAFCGDPDEYPTFMIIEDLRYYLPNVRKVFLVERNSHRKGEFPKDDWVPFLTHFKGYLPKRDLPEVAFIDFEGAGVHVWHATEQPLRHEYHGTVSEFLGMGAPREFKHCKNMLPRVTEDGEPIYEKLDDSELDASESEEELDDEDRERIMYECLSIIDIRRDTLGREPLADIDDATESDKEECDGWYERIYSG